VRLRAARVGSVVVCLVSLLGAAAAHAAAAGIAMPRSALSSAAVDAAAGSFALRGTLGEAGPVGAAASGGFRLGQGFWAPVFFLNATDASPPAASGIQWADGLAQSFPNPFRDAATFAFTVARESRVTLQVYDVTGRRIATLVDDERAPGRHAVRWDGRDHTGRTVGTGVYFYRIRIGSWSDSKRLLRLR
jgi:hypothetical protein